MNLLPPAQREGLVHEDQGAELRVLITHAEEDVDLVLDELRRLVEQLEGGVVATDTDVSDPHFTLRASTNLNIGGRREIDDVDCFRRAVGY